MIGVSPSLYTAYTWQNLLDGARVFLILQHTRTSPLAKYVPVLHNILAKPQLATSKTHEETPDPYPRTETSFHQLGSRIKPHWELMMMRTSSRALYFIKLPSSLLKAVVLTPSVEIYTAMHLSLLNRFNLPKELCISLNSCSQAGSEALGWVTHVPTVERAMWFNTNKSVSGRKKIPLKSLGDRFHLT